MESFWALVTNPHVFVQFPHVITGALATAGFFVLGISAWHLRHAQGRRRRARPSGARSGSAPSTPAPRPLAVVVVGHTQAQHMTRVQPMKMASAEALWETANPAPMSLFTWGDEPARKDVFALKVPGMLSFLAYNRFAGEVKGIRQLEAEYEARYGPGSYVPPIKWTYWTFRAMVGAGMLMLALAAWALVAGPARALRGGAAAAGAAGAGAGAALRRELDRLDLHRDRARALDRLRPDAARGGRLARGRPGRGPARRSSASPCSTPR